MNFFGSSSASPEIKTADFNCDINKVYIVDTSLGEITATLPATASNGNKIKFCDGANFETNSLIIDRNGNTIKELDEDMTVDVYNISFDLIFYNNNWLIG
jgi:translation elongation factor P/translation initiation factor 5A